MKHSLPHCDNTFQWFHVCRFAYAPYQVLKSCGIKGPTPVPFFGNYREEIKMASGWFNASLFGCLEYIDGSSKEQHLYFMH